VSTEQIRKRQSNRYRVLRTLQRSGPMSRSRLSDGLGIRKSSIGSIIRELLASGLVQEETPANTRSRIGIAGQQHSVLSASVTREATEVAEVTTDGTCLRRRHLAHTNGSDPNRLLPWLAHELARMLCESDRTVIGAGVAVPGLVDPHTGHCLRSVNLDNWRDVSVRSAITGRLSLPVFVDNDVRAQLWSCTWFDRLAGDDDNVIYVHLDDGVACAVMVHGRRIVGERFAAGEIGHVCAGDEGRLCTCGKLDCLETYCCREAIASEIRKVRPQVQLSSAADIAHAAAENPFVVNVLDRVTQRLARSLTGLVAAIDPHTVVLGTASREFSALIHPLLQRHLYAELIGLDAGDAGIAIADDVATSTLRGIAGLVIERFFRDGAGLTEDD